MLHTVDTVLGWMHTVDVTRSGDRWISTHECVTGAQALFNLIPPLIVANGTAGVQMKDSAVPYAEIQAAYSKKAKLAGDMVTQYKQWKCHERY